MNIKHVILISTSFAIFIASIFLAVPYWYYGEWKDGLGIEPVTIITCGWAVAVGILMFCKTIKYKTPYREIFVLIVTIILSDSIIDTNKSERIKSNSSITYAKVQFIGTRTRRGFGIEYKYTVNGIEFLKWDSDKTFIKKEKLAIGDSIRLVYNKLDPNMHEFYSLLYK